MKEIGVQDHLAIRAIEALNEGVLHRLPRFDVQQRDVPGVRPVHERLRRQLGAVVQADLVGTSVEGDELVEHAPHAHRRD